jgi:FkbH-like protein
LKTQIVIRAARNEDLERVHQLISKTNQINLTTNRYAMSEIQNFHRDSSFDLTIVSAKDAFGDLGVIGLYLLQQTGNEMRIDSFVLSCRALGRGVETAVMNHIKQTYGPPAGSTLEAEFMPTAKNKPAADFYEKQGLAIREQTSDGGKRYSLGPDGWELKDCSWIQVLKG